MNGSNNLSEQNVRHNCHDLRCTLQCFSSPWFPLHWSTYFSLLHGKLPCIKHFALHCYQEIVQLDTNSPRFKDHLKISPGLLTCLIPVSIKLDRQDQSSDLQWPGIPVSLMLLTVMFSIPRMRLVSSKCLISSCSSSSSFSITSLTSNNSFRIFVVQLGSTCSQKRFYHFWISPRGRLSK